MPKIQYGTKHKNLSTITYKTKSTHIDAGLQVVGVQPPQIVEAATVIPVAPLLLLLTALKIRLFLVKIIRKIICFIGKTIHDYLS
jgi:hypothetical protein